MLTAKTSTARVQQLAYVGDRLVMNRSFSLSDRRTAPKINQSSPLSHEQYLSRSITTTPQRLPSILAPTFETNSHIAAPKTDAISTSSTKLTPTSSSKISVAENFASSRILLFVFCVLLMGSGFIFIFMFLMQSKTTTTYTTDTSTISPVVYSQIFTNAVTSSTQCTAWNSFIASTNSSSSYRALTISGTNDPIGIALTNSTVVNAIIHALQTNTAYGPVSWNGFQWTTGSCGLGNELTATGSVCMCNTGYTIRPCIGNSNWGGINGTSCNAATQNITVTIL